MPICPIVKEHSFKRIENGNVVILHAYNNLDKNSTFVSCRLLYICKFT